MKTREAEESLPVRRASSLFSSSGSGPGLISWVGRGQGRGCRCRNWTSRCVVVWSLTRLRFQVRSLPASLLAVSSPLFNSPPAAVSSDCAARRARSIAHTNQTTQGQGRDPERRSRWLCIASWVWKDVNLEFLFPFLPLPLPLPHPDSLGFVLSNCS